MIDCHCDALYKMWKYQLDFEQDDQLDVSYSKWIQSPVQVQCFAIFIPPDVPMEAKFAAALQMVDIFFEKIIKPYHNVHFIQTRQDLLQLKDTQKGAVLTLEGLDCIGADLYKLRILLHLGVKMVGLSWNHANIAVDGIEEERKAGLSRFGKEVIVLLNTAKVWTDLSHISTTGFYQALELADHVIVSHANSYSICPHQRNLTDQQVEAVAAKGGLIGVTFVKEFVTEQEKATIQHLFAHIRYLLQIAGEEALVFGSDFDGTDQFIEHVTSIEDYNYVLAYLSAHLSQKQLNQISWQNFVRVFPCEQ
ncbi:dipeptidase [Gracilibacillus alcaliphilus]|uniref:dipeptidase n=1 Tax=Gracilibacillus alcaliphilus TaxID=1401441 RepID=UPI001956A552|nr:membrane dipeptidase [Gracilibacillus alcaliphilus]MBM7676633.1 membrane dipeptidase [Gracilibacillus alcaliphilus]